MEKALRGTSRFVGLTGANGGTNEVIHQAGLSTFDIRSAIRQQLGQGSGWLLQQAAGFLGDLTGVLMGAMVTAITLFFLFREGGSLRERVASIVPLAADHLQRLFNGVHEVVVASVYGILAIGLLQGILVGFSFWLLGLPSPVLWGLVTAFLSLIPIVGTGGVWIPAAHHPRGQWALGEGSHSCRLGSWHRSPG